MRPTKLALSLCLLGTLLAPGPATAADSDSEHARVALRGARGISAFVGMRATWEPLFTADSVRKTCELPADLFEYASGETPGRASLLTHTLYLSPIPKEPRWYSFGPIDDEFDLSLDIADEQGGLGKAIVSDLSTGDELAVVLAAKGGASIKGTVHTDWRRAYYRIDVYSTSHSLLFVLCATNGTPDTFVHFSRTGLFQPHRPATVVTPRFNGCRAAFGPEGDPSIADGILVATTGSPDWSMGCCSADQLNDNSWSWTLGPPQPFDRHSRRLCLEHVQPQLYTSNPEADHPLFWQEAYPLQDNEFEGVLGAAALPPFSDCTAHWHEKYTGHVKAYFVIPYCVAKHREVKEAILRAFDKLDVTTKAGQGELSAALWNEYVLWLTSIEGRKSRLRMDYVKPAGDVKWVTATQERCAIEIAKGLTAPVTFTLGLESGIPLPSGVGKGSIVSCSAATNPPPPPAAEFDRSLVFISSSTPPWTVTRQLPKGYKILASGNITSPACFSAGTSPEQIIFGPTTIRMSSRLVGTLRLRVETILDTVPNPPGTPVAAEVELRDAHGQVVSHGISVRDASGFYAWVAHGVAPGVYRLSARAVRGGKLLSASYEIAIQTGPVDEVGFILTMRPQEPANK